MLVLSYGWWGAIKALVALVIIVYAMIFGLMLFVAIIEKIIKFRKLK